MAMGPAPKCHFVLGLPSGSLEIPKVRTPAILRVHNFVCRLSIEMRSKEKLNPCRKLFNGIWHTTYKQGNRGDSQLLVVGNQIANLTPGLFLGHNLCLKCPNRSCEPNLDIYVSRAFQ